MANMGRQLMAWVRYWDNASEKLASGIRWVALVMVLLTVCIVVLRYGFAISAIAVQESVMYLHGLLFLLGIPYGLKAGSHVRVDILYTKFTPRTQTLVDLTGHIIFLLPVALFILITSIPYAWSSWQILEGSSEVGGLPAVFLLKSLIPIAALLLTLQGASEIAKGVGTLLSRH